MARARAYNPRKREWESSLSEEEQWRKLARTVPAMLVNIGTSRKAIKSAMKVKATIKTTRRRGITNASELLDGVHDKIARISATRAEAGHVFAHCTTHLGFQGGAPWQAWEGHRADAVRFAKDARWCLCRAGGAVEAAQDVFRVVQWRSGSRLPREAKDLLRRAGDDVSKALDALRDMHHAIVLEFFDAWVVLNRNH